MRHSILTFAGTTIYDSAKVARVYFLEMDRLFSLINIGKFEQLQEPFCNNYKACLNSLYKKKIYSAGTNESDFYELSYSSSTSS